VVSDLRDPGRCVLGERRDHRQWRLRILHLDAGRANPNGEPRFRDPGRRQHLSDGWSIGGGGIDYIGSYWAPAGGTHSIDLNALTAGSIFQTISTVVGQAYEVSFDLAGNPDSAPVVKLAIADATGLPGAAYLFDTTGKTKTNMGWTQLTYDFTADSTSTTLTFSNSNQTGFKTPYGAALDNISISAVPEPATWAVMLIGFGGLGAAMRSRRSRRAVVA
jgi:choice-of-anchor C domain-containing protein